MGAKRFRIAFSFAGEKRDFVAVVARLLADHFGEEVILYDKFHEAEFANSDLAFNLPALYKDEADLIVAVFCTNYEHKEWCGLEWRAIFSIIKEGGVKQVMLTRFNQVDCKGLHGLAGFIELDKKTPKEVAAFVLERLALNEGLRKDHYAKPSASPLLKTSIPHNLPTLQPFFGREDELKKIADALDPENRGWGALIDGPGGMGKTSLAVRAAYDASPEDFKRIVFVSLKARELDDDGLRDLSGFLITGLAELLNELARELGHGDIAKALEVQRPRMLLDILRGSQALLVLDNLESLTKPERDLLFTFVKKLPVGCKAILTSRGRIGSGAEELILEKLSKEAALATLAELATHNPHLAKTDEAERLVLYRETGGKPLLLRWTAGQLGRGHCLTFADALDFLRSCPKGNDPLEFIFGDLIENFTPEETRVLSVLTYFTLPAKIEHVAELVQYSMGKTDQALRSLSVRSLAVPNDESKTFTLVPLVSDFLRKKNPTIVTEIGARLEECVFVLARENGNGNYDLFHILDAAWPTIAAALPRFLVGSNKRLQTLCSALSIFLDFTGRWDEWLALSRDAEGRAKTEKDFGKAGLRAYDVGWIYCLRGQPNDALLWADRAENYWRSLSNARENAEVIRLRGYAHELNKNYPAAITAYTKAVEIDRSLNPESADVAADLSSLADIKVMSKDFEGAESDYREALRIARVAGMREMIAGLPGNLASLALARKDWVGAESLAKQALSQSEIIGRQELIASNALRVAVALMEQRRKLEAIPYAQRALTIFNKLGSPGAKSASVALQKCKVDSLGQGVDANLQLVKFEQIIWNIQGFLRL